MVLVITLLDGGLPLTKNLKNSQSKKSVKSTASDIMLLYASSIYNFREAFSSVCPISDVISSTFCTIILRSNNYLNK